MTTINPTPKGCFAAHKGYAILAGIRVYVWGPKGRAGWRVATAGPETLDNLVILPAPGYANGCVHFPSKRALQEALHNAESRGFAWPWAKRA